MTDCIAYWDALASRQVEAAALLRAAGARLFLADGPESLAREAAVAIVGLADIREALPALTAAAQADPARPVVLLWAGGDAAALLAAMRAGVRDVAATPAELPEVLARVRGRAERPPGRPGRVIAVYALKGGIGKSFLAVNMAMALRRASRLRTTAVDLSLPCGNMEMYMDLHPPCCVSDLLAVGTELDQGVLAQALARHPGGVDLLAGPRSGSWDALGRHSCAPILDALTAHPGLVVVDVGAYLDTAHMAALKAADMVVVPVTPQIASVSTMPQVRVFLASLGVPESRILPVLNHVAPCGEEVTGEAIARLLGGPARHVLPHAGSDVAASLNTGKPLVEEQPGHPVSRAIEALAGDLLERMGIPSQAPAAERTVPNLFQALLMLLRQKGLAHVRS